MELQEVAEPEPGEGEVVVRTGAAAICGSDLHGFREASPRRIPPLVMGHEAVGIVDAAGPGVDTDRIGERVVLRPILGCGTCASCATGATNLCRDGRLVGRDLPGAFAERFVVPSQAAVRLPDALPDEVAVMTEPLANAVHVASNLIREGASVFVIGAGPIGALMVTAARLLGAAQVWVSDLDRGRLGFARDLGGEPLDAGSAVDEVLAASDGQGADVVIDAVGLEATWRSALDAVRPGGTIVEVGLGAPTGSLDYFRVVNKEAIIRGSYGWREPEFDVALAWLATGKVTVDGWISHAPLADGQRAFEELVDGDGSRFKVVLGFG
jgi:2-desacetyl-2-hydroxyethyl bacteriochlorophyllide A dehydrogenase